MVGQTRSAVQTPRLHLWQRRCTCLPNPIQSSYKGPFSLRPQFDPKGWSHWPDHEEFSTEFMRLLGAAQEGGSIISECFLTASRIDASNEDSWFQEWKRIADASNERAERAI